MFTFGRQFNGDKDPYRYQAVVQALVQPVGTSLDTLKTQARQRSSVG